MGVRYEIDPEHRLVTTTLSGTLSFDDCVAHHHALAADPTFDPSYHELIDGSGVEKVTLISSAVFSLTMSCPYGPHARRAISTGDKKINFALARMFQSLSGGKLGEIEVFKCRQEALRWLEADARPDESAPETSE